VVLEGIETVVCVVVEVDDGEGLVVTVVIGTALVVVTGRVVVVEASEVGVGDGGIQLAVPDGEGDTGSSWTADVKFSS